MINKEDKIISLLIVGVWFVMLLFGLFTLLKPTWLEKAAKPGVNVEAATKKHRGDLYLENKRYAQAIGLYKEAILLVPDMEGAYSNLAMAYYHTGRLSSAITTYKKLLKHNPDFPDIVNFNLAEIYNKTENKEKALHYYIKASETAPFPDKAYRKAGKLLMDKRNWQQASAQFVLALANSPTLVNLYRGMLLQNLVTFKDDTTIKKNIQVALDSNHFEKLNPYYDTKIIDDELSYNPDIAKTHNYLGYCYAMLGKYNEAKQQFEAALKIEPGYDDATNNLGAVNRLMKKER